MSNVREYVRRFTERYRVFSRETWYSFYLGGGYMERKTYTIQAIERATGILRVLLNNPGGLSLDELSLRTGLHRATTYRILMNLLQEGFVERDHSTTYKLGPLCIQLGGAALSGLSWKDIAEPIMNKITEQTGESVYLWVRSGWEVVCIASSPSPHAIQHYGYVGQAFPLCAGESGRLFMAYLSEEEVKLCLKENLSILPRFPGTITEEAALLQDLADIREKGYCVSKMEVSHDGVGISAPIKDYRGSIIAAISLVGPVNRITDDCLPGLISIVTDGAQQISALLGSV